MSVDTKVDKDYKDAFNLGYELAKELNLKSPMFKDVSSGNDRMNAMQAGMEQYSIEKVEQKNEENTFGLNNNSGIPKEHKNRGKGFDLSI
jgi:hypothetical protein